MKYKVGDRVKCIDASNSYLEFGKVYEVLGTSNDCQFVKFIDDYQGGWSSIRFDLLKDEKEIMIQEDKKYWTVDGHYPVRIVCTDVKNEKSVLALYTASDEEWLLNINKHGQDNYGNQIIEQVPKIDWSTVALDTPIWVKQYQRWGKQHFAKFNHELNAVCYWDERRTSHTAEHEFDYSSVRSDYAVLTNPNA